MASKTAAIQYKFVTTLAGNNNALADCLQITNDHVVMFEYHMHYPVFMTCTRGAVTSVYISVELVEVTRPFLL